MAALVLVGTVFAAGSSFAAKSHTHKSHGHKSHRTTKKAPKARTATTTISAIGDTYVDQAHPRTNYVRARVLRVAGHPQRRALIRFWVPRLGGRAKSVSIRAFTSRTRHGRLVVHATRCNYNNSSVTWNSRPRIGGRLAVRRKAIGNRYNGWTLPRRALPAKGGPVCFYITAHGKTPVNLGAWNRDLHKADQQTTTSQPSASQPPQLIVTTTGGSTPAPASAPASAPAKPAPAPSSGTSGSTVGAAADMGVNAGLAPTKFLSPSGSDSAACTQAAPCRTLAHADQVAKPGDVISVADGTYDGGVLSASGTSSARITYVAQNHWGASIRSLLDVRGAYVDIRNFDVTGSSNGGVALNASYDRAIRNHIHNLPIACGNGAGLWAGNGNDSPVYGSHDQELLYNVVADIGPAGGWSGGTCQLSHGIYASVPNAKIIGNLVYHTIGDGITSWHAATHLTVVNNTVANAGSDGILIGNGDGGGSSAGNTGSYIANNISVNNYRHGITESGTASGNTFRNNLTMGNGTDCISCSTWSKDESGTITADPKFVGGGDYHLQAGSPGVDSGTATNAAPWDLDGHARPMGGGVDRGAEER
jgi:hypothetical protein